jgi:hypothetical protein
MSLVLDVNGLSIRMAHSLRKTPTCEGRGGRLPSCRDSCSTHSLQRRNRWSPQRHGFSAPSVHGERVRQPVRRRGWFPVTQRRGHPWALLETRQRPRLGAAVGEERPWRKLSAN